MNKTKIELTEEQKKCVEHPLENEQVLIIDADPGTGKTEILKLSLLISD
jgi:hypothetical protein